MTRIDRRALFTSGAAAALLTASGVSLEAAPKKGGKLRLAIPRDDETLETLVRGAVFETLTEVAPDGSLHGDLATDWIGTSDARVWEFRLREGVCFHNGQPLVADDVIDSLQAHNPAVLADVVSLEATDVLCVRLELTSGNPDLPIALADSKLTICASGNVDLPLSEADGTGCYKVRYLDPNRRFLGTNVPGHHKAEKAGWFDSVEAVVIPDANVRSEALRDGYVDVAVLPHPDGLVNRNSFLYHPSVHDMALVAHKTVGIPPMVSSRGALDDGRIAQRWWKL